MLCKSVRWLEHCKELRHVLEFDELGQTVDIVHLMNNLQIDRYIFFESIELQIFKSNRTNFGTNSIFDNLTPTSIWS